MKKKLNSLTEALKITQSKFFAYGDTEMAKAQAVIAKDEEKKKNALEKQEKEKLKAEKDLLKFNKKVEVGKIVVDDTPPKKVDWETFFGSE
jgi:hypothetical protein